MSISYTTLKQLAVRLRKQDAITLFPESLFPERRTGSCSVIYSSTLDKVSGFESYGAIERLEAALDNSDDKTLLYSLSRQNEKHKT